MKVSELMSEWSPGSHNWSWEEEFNWVDTNEDSNIKEVFRVVDEYGIGFADNLNPILLGADGRVWDGHHRIRVAVLLGIEEVYVRIMPGL